MKQKLLILLICTVTWTHNKCAAQGVTMDESQLSNPSMQGEAEPGGNVVNVDLFTGIASVNIPICNKTVDGLDVSVSLSYNAKGIAVDQISSSVGLGWELNAGGYIVRQVNGQEDEVVFPYEYTSFFTSDGYTISEVGSSNYLGRLVGPAITGTYETQHDDFTAVFGGRSIEFAIDSNGNLCTSPHCNIQVQMIVDGVYYTHGLPGNIDIAEHDHLLSFLITDEKGNKFRFDRGDYEYKSSPYVGTYYPTTKWVLTNITTSTGKTVTYTYNAFHLQYMQYALDSATETLDYGSGIFTGGAIGSLQYTPWTGYVSHISSIQYPDGTNVVFNMTDTNARCDVKGIPFLTSIKISNGYDAIVNNSITYSLSQSYFNSMQSPSSPLTDPLLGSPELAASTTSCPAITELLADGVTSDVAMDSVTLGMRLKLNAIMKIGNDGTTSELYYKFGYNTTQLPYRLSVAQDWYGYFNNHYSTATHDDGTPVAVPEHTTDDGSSNGGVDKTPAFNYMQACVLNSITNGKGGITNLYYQVPPNLNNPVTTLPPDMDEAVNTYDGLCFEHMSTYDGMNIGDSLSTYYQFYRGYRFYPGAYFWYPASYQNWNLNARLLINHMVTPLDFFHGSNHGYSDVTVYKKGFASEILSRTDYGFKNILDGSGISYLIDTQTQASFHTFPRTSMDQPQMGLTDTVSEYGNGSVPIKITTLSYTTQSYPPLINYETLNYFCLLMADTWTKDTFITASRYYDIFTSSFVGLTKKIEFTKLGTGVMTNETDMTYDSHNQLSQTNNLDSKGAMWSHQFFHNYDYDFSTYTPGCTAGITAKTAILAMNANNLAVVIAEEKRKNGNWPTATTDSIVAYTQWFPTYTGSILNLNTSSNSTISSPIATSIFHGPQPYSFFNANSFFCYDNYVSSSTQITKYDDHNDILEAWGNNHTRCASNIWDTRIGKKVATVTNAQYSQIAYTSFEGHFAPYGTADYNKGNWDFISDYIVLGTATDVPMTGRYYLQMLSGVGSVTSTIVPANGQQFLISFWCKGSVPNVILPGSPTVSISMTAQNTVGSWTLYTAYFTGNGVSNVSISATSTIGIDELRLIPANAGISTCTYEPFVGISSQNDERNNITYYRYDVMGRLSTTRDINGNIISLNTTVMQGHD